MADKEDLISIELFEKRKDGGFYRVDGKSMTRQEAITSIVKALKKEKIKCFVVKGYSISDDRCAEIALNALLGVEK